jgi:hypothetical protein
MIRLTRIIEVAPPFRWAQAISIATGLYLDEEDWYTAGAYAAWSFTPGAQEGTWEALDSGTGSCDPGTHEQDSSKAGAIASDECGPGSSFASYTAPGAWEADWSAAGAVEEDKGPGFTTGDDFKGG